MSHLRWSHWNRDLERQKHHSKVGWQSTRVSVPLLVQRSGVHELHHSWGLLPALVCHCRHEEPHHQKSWHGGGYVGLLRGLLRHHTTWVPAWRTHGAHRKLEIHKRLVNIIFCWANLICLWRWEKDHNSWWSWPRAKVVQVQSTRNFQCVASFQKRWTTY